MLDSCITNYFPYDKNLLLWVTVTVDGQEWFIASDINRSMYYLYKGKKQTRYKSENPLDLDKYIFKGE